MLDAQYIWVNKRKIGESWRFRIETISFNVN